MVRASAALACPLAVIACGGGGAGGDGRPPGSAPDWVGDVQRAVALVEAELGEGQEFFEVTANVQLTNVFVAVDGATAAMPYVYLDGELLDPAPRLEGASGETFTAGAIGFDPNTVLSRVERELPTVTVDALSVEGGPNGAVRYIVSARSEQGGVLDIEVAGDGAILAVDPR